MTKARELHYSQTLLKEWRELNARAQERLLEAARYEPNQKDYLAPPKLEKTVPLKVVEEKKKEKKKDPWEHYQKLYGKSSFSFYCFVDQLDLLELLI